MSDSLYQQAIKDLAQAAHGSGRLAAPDKSADRDNPFCGDRIHIEVRLDAGIIVELAHSTRGCLLCRAAAALVGRRAPGLDAAAAARAADALAGFLAADAEVPAEWPEFAIFAPARAHASRHGCALLPFEALQTALED